MKGKKTELNVHQKQLVLRAKRSEIVEMFPINITGVADQIIPCMSLVGASLSEHHRDVLNVRNFYITIVTQASAHGHLYFNLNFHRTGCLF